jgi:hypothetical protein
VVLDDGELVLENQSLPVPGRCRRPATLVPVSELIGVRVGRYSLTASPGHGLAEWHEVPVARTP